MRTGGGGGRQGLAEALLGSQARPAHGLHLLTQLGLVVLHHVEDALQVGVDRVARTRRLREQRKNKERSWYVLTGGKQHQATVDWKCVNYEWGS